MRGFRAEESMKSPSPRTGWAPLPFKRPPMISNSPQLGFPPAVAAATGFIFRWAVPWVLTAGGILLTSTALKNAFPTLPINTEKVGLAALLGGAGITSYLVSDLIPGEYKAIPYALAVAGVAGSLYFLFSPPEEKPKRDPGFGPGRTPEKERVPEGLPPGHLAQMITVELDPTQADFGGLWRNKFADQQYRFCVQNHTNKSLSFWAGLKILDDNGKPVTPGDYPPFPAGGSSVTPSKYARQYVEQLAPGGEPRCLELWAPSLGTSAPLNTTVAVELFRDKYDTKPFMTSEAILIVQVAPLVAGLK